MPLFNQLIRPEFRFLHNKQHEILDTVSKLVEIMANVAVDPHHTPALYATLLRSLVASKREEMKAEPESSTENAKAAADGSGDTTGLGQAVGGVPLGNADTSSGNAIFSSGAVFSGGNGVGGWNAGQFGTGLEVGQGQQGQEGNSNFGNNTGFVFCP